MKEFVLICIITYGFFSIVAFGNGYLDAKHSWKPCNKKIRGGFLLPTYKLGCYLGEEIE